MKIYLSQKDKKIQQQQRLIDKLTDENKCLKEQLESLDAQNLEKKIKIVEESRSKYKNLITQLELLKKEYKTLNQEMSVEKEELVKLVKHNKL